MMQPAVPPGILVPATTRRSLMTSNAERAAILVRALEASVVGDSTVIADLYTDDVRGRASELTVSSAAELAVEFEDRGSACADIEFDISPFDVADDRACIEWVVTLTRTAPPDYTDEDTGHDRGADGTRVTLRGITVAEFDGDKISSFRQYSDEVAGPDHPDEVRKE
jgi:SnoaL-like domain